MAIIFVHERAHTRQWNPPEIVRWIANVNSSIKAPKFAAKKSINVMTTVKTTKTNSDERDNNGKARVKNGVVDMVSPTSRIMEAQDAVVNLLRKADEQLEYWKKRHEIRRIWITALDRIDLLLLVIFLVLNCALTYAMLLGKGRNFGR
jgi:hypothetical protein